MKQGTVFQNRNKYEKGNSPQNVKPVTSLFHCADPKICTFQIESNSCDIAALLLPCRATTNVGFPRIFATSIHTPRRCLIILRNCLKAARNNITDRYNSQNHRRVLACKLARCGKHCDYSSFMHYVFTKILRHSYAVLNCASMKANILHVQKCPDRLPSLSISGASADN
ncbi:hypothetical protein Tsp_07544 [Trichinella spiralis]|uniref:hypothetical protein n=1 Tax=Trichinella spiralis TaxID=6334 RepID=UPI0001EFB5AA|nr:hypothetical protein Tsp_07544 [Trichinella spiralis]